MKTKGTKTKLTFLTCFPLKAAQIYLGKESSSPLPLFCSLCSEAAGLCLVAGRPTLGRESPLAPEHSSRHPSPPLVPVTPTLHSCKHSQPAQVIREQVNSLIKSCSVVAKPKQFHLDTLLLNAA